MIYSKHNIFSQIAGSDNFFIVNLLSGNADILTAKEGRMLMDHRAGKDMDADLLSNLTEKGYFTDEKEEEKIYRSK